MFCILGGALNDYPCGGESTASEWLAQPDVVKALHVKADGGGMTYQKGKSSLLKVGLGLTML